ncbi:ABC transporter permease [Rhodococcus rhodochrous]|uniref:ABC transporter permease n=1 Tax=Rhodococcus rhodochrous TaxID=1829 RepID=UPI00037C0221|nr:ABC transporter permease [Rhodococcus rhodochrous]
MTATMTPVVKAGKKPSVVKTEKKSRNKIVRRLLRKPVAVISFGFLAMIGLVAIIGPWIMPHDPAAQDLLSRLQGPSAEHWLGTDSYGRDNLSRLIQGTRTSVLAAIQGTSLAVLIGVPAGLIAGYQGKVIDRALSWVANVLLALPALILLFAIIGILGPGLTNAMIGLGIVLAPGFFRIARGAAISVRNETYIEAAISVGCTPTRALVRHVLPNSIGPLLVQTTYSLGMVVVAESSLSFLGFGVEQPIASWGSMVKDSFNNIYETAFPLLAPALMITLTILAFSLLGDAVRDALGRQARVGE